VEKELISCVQCLECHPLSLPSSVAVDLESISDHRQSLLIVARRSSSSHQSAQHSALPPGVRPPAGYGPRHAGREAGWTLASWWQLPGFTRVGETITKRA